MRQSSTQTGTPLDVARPVVVLVAICIVAGLLLGLVHDLTSPVATANAEQRARDTYSRLVPQAVSFEHEPVNVEGCTAALKALDAQQNTIGHVFVTQAKGYGGQLPIAVAFDTAGVVTNITVMANKETPGLGTKVADVSHIGQYVGLSAQGWDPASVNLVSGATISSKAVLTAFALATQAYEEVC